MTTRRIVGIDLLRGIAAFGIVGCHLGLHPYTPSAAFLRHYSDMCVGLFGVISGMLMAKTFFDCDVRDWGKIIVKRCCRLLPSYLCFTCVYLTATFVFDLALDGHEINPRFFSFGFWLSVIFCGGSCSQLWYVIYLVYWQAFLVVIWRLCPSMLRSRVIVIALSLLALWSSVSASGHFNFYFMRLGAFLLLGIAIGGVTGIRKGICTHSVVSIWLVAGLAGHYLLRNNLPAFYLDYFCAIPIVVFFISLPAKGNKAASWLGATSYGVYLIHGLPAALTKWAICQYCPAPRGAIVVAADWIVLWLLSVLSLSVMLKTNKLAWCVR